MADLWPFEPISSVTESLEWLTDVIRTVSKEQRISARKQPRQELSCTYHLSPAQLGRAKAMAQAYAAKRFLVPLWPEWHAVGVLSAGATSLPKNEYNPMYSAGQSVLIWQSDTLWEVKEITSASNPYSQITLQSGLANSYTRAVVVPLREGSFAQEFSVEREARPYSVATARFRIIVSNDFSTRATGLYLGSAPQYRSRRVVTDRALTSVGIRESYRHELDVLDSELGDFAVVQLRTQPDQSSQVSWIAKTAQERWDLLYWLHSRKGRWKSFWVPSWNKDVTLAHAIDAADTTLRIADIGIRELASFPIDLMLQTREGTRYFFRVTGVTSYGGGEELLTLEQAFGASVQIWETDLICFLSLSRFAADRIELQHDAGTCQVSAPIQGVPL